MVRDSEVNFVHLKLILPKKKTVDLCVALYNLNLIRPRVLNCVETTFRLWSFWRPTTCMFYPVTPCRVTRVDACWTLHSTISSYEVDKSFSAIKAVLTKPREKTGNSTIILTSTLNSLIDGKTSFPSGHVIVAVPLLSPATSKFKLLLTSTLQYQRLQATWLRHDQHNTRTTP